MDWVRFRGLPPPEKIKINPDELKQKGHMVGENETRLWLGCNTDRL